MLLETELYFSTSGLPGGGKGDGVLEDFLFLFLVRFEVGLLVHEVVTFPSGEEEEEEGLLVLLVVFLVVLLLAEHTMNDGKLCETHCTPMW